MEFGRTLENSKLGMPCETVRQKLQIHRVELLTRSTNKPQNGQIVLVGAAHCIEGTLMLVPFWIVPHQGSGSLFLRAQRQQSGFVRQQINSSRKNYIPASLRGQ